MSSLTIFNNQIENLLNDLIKILPDNKDLTVGKEKFNLLRSMNARKTHKLFMEYVYPHKEHINNKNGDFFSDNLENFSQEEKNDKNKETFDKIFNFRELWKDGLTKNDKNIIWKYFQVLIILAERANK